MILLAVGSSSNLRRTIFFLKLYLISHLCYNYSLSQHSEIYLSLKTIKIALKSAMMGNSKNPTPTLDEEPQKEKDVYLSEILKRNVLLSFLSHSILKLGAYFECVLFTRCKLHTVSTCTLIGN